MGTSSAQHIRSTMADSYNPKEQIPCKICGNRVQQDGMATGWPDTTARYTRGEGDDTTWVRSVPTNGTRPSMTGGTCLVGGWDDPILLQGHAAGLMLDRWFWFNEITGDKEDATYQRVVKLRQTYGPYRKG